jgi:hypothetical protein
VRYQRACEPPEPFLRRTGIADTYWASRDRQCVLAGHLASETSQLLVRLEIIQYEGTMWQIGHSTGQISLTPQ